MKMKPDDTPDVLANRVDLGDLDGPVLLFGGPYSNLQATTALFDHADANGFPASRIICNGDVCAYCADPLATTHLVMQRGCAVVAGNCEDSLGHEKPDCGCGFVPGGACSLDAGEWYRHSDSALTGDEREWMKARPTLALFSHAGKRYAVIHAAASAINTFLWPTVRDVHFAYEIALVEAAVGPVDGIIAGHTGIPFQRSIYRLDGNGSVHWINPGAIGLPPHDGQPETCFAVLDQGKVTMKRLSYDHAAAAEAMREAGMKARYHASLECSWWPNEDTFPPEMRCGQTA